MADAGVVFPTGQRWDAAVLLGVGAFLLVARLPLAIPLIGVLSAGVLVLQGLVPRRGFGLGTVFFGVSLAASAAATLRAPSTLVGGYFSWAVCFALLAAAAWFSGSVERNLRMLLGGIYAGLWFHFIVSMAELVTGVKILVLRDPRAASVPVMLDDPWVVSSLFVNYNDYSVAMVIFVNLLLARLLFGIGRQARWRSIVQGVAAATAGVLVVVIGSRGALVALVGTVALELLVVVRFRHPERITSRHLWALLAAGGGVLLVAWNTPYFQSHSTEWRGMIVTYIVALMLANPLTLLTGFGSAEAFANVGKIAYPGELLNPHNFLLEVAMAFGVPALVVLVAWLATVVIEGVVRQRIPMSADGTAALVTAVGLLGYGSVPSSYLDYGYLFFFLVAGSSALYLGRRAGIDGASVSLANAAARPAPAPAS
nr:O-antigen ligase family protein [Propionibacterium sp.]